MSSKKNKAQLALTGFLLWLCLSPHVARKIYEAVLMPRIRSELPFWKGPADTPVEELAFQTGRKQELKGHYYKHPKARKLVIYFGGRRSNIHKNSIRAEALLKATVSVFTFEYRGFGDAAGKATSRSIVEDGLAAYDAVRTLGFNADQIVLYGESLGVAVASYVSARRPAAALILQSGFSSLDEQVKDMFPLLRIYPSFMFPRQNLSAVRHIAFEHPPLLVIHGDRDPVVQAKHAKRLAKAGGKNTTLVMLEGADHGEVYERSDWLETVTKFLDSIN